MNIVGIVFTLAAVVVVLCMSRRAAVLGIIAAVCYITQSQQVDIVGFHFTSARVVLMAGLFRIFIRNEVHQIRLNSIDKCLAAYVVLSTLIATVGAGGAIEVLVYQLGFAYNVLVSYFVFRGLVTNLLDVETTLADLAILIVPFSLFMIQESINGRNFFSFFGGVGATDQFRDGHFRCEAAFRSPITAGTLGATLMPLFVGLFLVNPNRRRSLVGILAATLIVWASRSSGPLIAYGSGLLALVFWRWRRRMRVFRWGVLIFLVSLHLYMKAPVWFFMGHVSDIVGGGGWYRAEIIDQAVNHFDSWWLCGTTDTSSWTVTPLAEGGADLTNQFVSAAVKGGITGLVIFVLIFVRSFRYLGLAMQKVRGVEWNVEFLLWVVGAALYGTLVNFFSVSYFDQIEVIWYFLLAIVSVVSFSVLNDQFPRSEILEDERKGATTAIFDCAIAR